MLCGSFAGVVWRGQKPNFWIRFLYLKYLVATGSNEEEKWALIGLSDLILGSRYYVSDPTSYLDKVGSCP